MSLAANMSTSRQKRCFITQASSAFHQQLTFSSRNSLLLYVAVVIRQLSNISDFDCREPCPISPNCLIRSSQQEYKGTLCWNQGKNCQVVCTLTRSMNLIVNKISKRGKNRLSSSVLSSVPHSVYVCYDPSTGGELESDTQNGGDQRRLASGFKLCGTKLDHHPKLLL